ncbi:MAG: patatin [Lachnospiraceae bacterium]|nr:patatin [Lachnospiraceae bacterium]
MFSSGGVDMNYCLSLSGGGPKGAAHIGVFKALEENHIKPSSVSGTSAGSFVCGLIAAGFSAEEMVKEVHFMAKNGLKVIDPDIAGLILSLPKMAIKKELSAKGIISGKQMEKYFRTTLGYILIKDLDMPVMIPAVDISTGKTIVFTNSIKNKPDIKNLIWYENAKLYEAIRASCSLPGIFFPKNIGDMTLVDGGLTYNLPYELNIANGEKKILAVDLGKKYEPPFRPDIGDILYSSFRIMQLSSIKSRNKNNEVMILHPPLKDDAGLFCFSCMEESMEIGYEYAIKNLDRIKLFLNT